MNFNFQLGNFYNYVLHYKFNISLPKFFLFNCLHVITFTMDSKTEKDPFAILDKKRVRITEFLVYLESEGGQDNYVIKQFNNTKEQNLEALKFIQNLIKSHPDMNSDRVKGYLKRQRFFIKLYLKEVNKDFSD